MHFADDISLMVEDVKVLQALTDRLNVIAGKLGYRIKSKNT